MYEQAARMVAAAALIFASRGRGVGRGGHQFGKIGAMRCAYCALREEPTSAAD
jgi:hypothetical protein